MSRLLLICVLLFGAYAASGQKIRMTDSSNTWKVHQSGGGSDYCSMAFYYSFQGDIALAGHSYKVLVGTKRLLDRIAGNFTCPEAGTFYIREDSLGEKVWCRAKDGWDTTEYLVYNAGWVVNDTILRSTALKAYINTIDSTQINGVWHRVFHVRATVSPFGARDLYDIVEGMGSTNGPGYPFSGFTGGEHLIKQQCFFNQGSRPALNPELTNLVYLNKFSNTLPCDLAVDDE